MVAVHHVDGLTPAGVAGIGNSRVAFQPLTGQAVVTWEYVNGSQGAVEVSTSPR